MVELNPLKGQGPKAPGVTVSVRGNHVFNIAISLKGKVQSIARIDAQNRLLVDVGVVQELPLHTWDLNHLHHMSCGDTGILPAALLDPSLPLSDPSRFRSANQL